MGKKTIPEVNEQASGKESVILREVMAILYNPARLASHSEPAVKGQRTRDNVPWVVMIPELSIVSCVLDEDGRPVYGYINQGVAITYCQALYNRLASNPDLLKSYQTQPDWYGKEKGYNGRTITIFFNV